MGLYLLIFFILSLVMVFAVPTYLIYKKTGINPITFGKEDNPHNYIGGVFKILIALLVVVFILNVFAPGFYQKFLLPIGYMQNPTVFYVGLVLLHLSMFWIFIAQMQMGKSWRIGIDEKNKTEFVTKGLFSVSRNPIFLGMIVAIFAAFLLLPNLFTFFIAFAGYIIIQIQIRLEEEFLQKQFGNEYVHYKTKTRRLI